MTEPKKKGRQFMTGFNVEKTNKYQVERAGGRFLVLIF